MVVLGLTLNHDASITIVKDGKILVAIARERLARLKKINHIKRFTIEYALETAGLTIDDVDHVAISYWTQNRETNVDPMEDFKFYVHPNDVHIFTPHFIPSGDHYWNSRKPKFVEGKGFEIDNDLISLLPPITVSEFPHIRINFDIYGRTITGWFVSHHHAHAASTFYTSNFEKSAIFTMDATDADPMLTSLFSFGDGNKIETLYYPGVMVAHQYALFTHLLGIGHPLFKAGSTMGLAPYGTPNLEIVANIDNYTKSSYEREFRVDDFRHTFNLFSKVTGHKIKFEDYKSAADISENYFSDYFSKENSDSQEAMNGAATIQYIFEETVFRFANILYDYTDGFNDNNLCLAGGGFLNCTTNGKITKKTKFKNVSPYPGAGDDGLSVGAALYVSHHILDIPRKHKTVSEVVYTGKNYETPNGGIPLDINFVASQISQGKVVAWFQGRSEFGPRALGNRSFLADPTNPKMRDYINFEIKNREWYRPFAPAVCLENVNEYFDIEGESPYMLKICNVISDKLPSVTHVDGTARVQTVKREDNPKFYDILRAFEKVSGVPVLLNTSLNLSDEPIVETPEHALRLFERSKTDILVINDSMWVK
jgi:carbamoyltransferase